MMTLMNNIGLSYLIPIIIWNYKLLAHYEIHIQPMERK